MLFRREFPPDPTSAIYTDITWNIPIIKMNKTDLDAIVSNILVDIDKYITSKSANVKIRSDYKIYSPDIKDTTIDNSRQWHMWNFIFLNKWKDAFWNNGAREITKGILISIWYKMKENKCLNINKFNMAEIISIVNDVNSLKQYFESLPSKHPARIASGSISALENALNDVLSTLKIKLRKFGDYIIRNLIAKNEIDWSNYSNQSSVFFIVSPDEWRDMNIFVSLFVTQLYKVLVEETDKCNGN